MIPYQLQLPEPASTRLELILLGETCVYHPGIELDGNDCERCAIAEADYIAEREHQLIYGAHHGRP